MTQPYASLVAIGAKKIETRSWSTSYRGPLAIHAAKTFGPGQSHRQFMALCARDPFCAVLEAAGYNGHRMPAWGLPLGAIVAVCELVDCIHIDDGLLAYEDPGVGWWIITEQERAFGDYSAGRWVWLLSDVRALPEPIPCRGALSLWEWDGEL